MEGLEQGLQVSHIATFPIKTCRPDQEITDVLGRFPTFDQIPVKQDGKIIGVLERFKPTPTGRVDTVMRSLYDAHLVEASEPLLKFLPRMEQVGFYSLVLSGRKIDGIVTRSDALKLPVRLLVYARIAHLEEILTEILRNEKDLKQETWVKWIPEAHRKSIQKRLADLKQEQSDPYALDLANFDDKRKIYNKFFKPKQLFDADEGIVKLRNQVAHVLDYASDEENLVVFLKRLKKVDEWIDRLTLPLNKMARARSSAEQ